MLYNNNYLNTHSPLKAIYLFTQYFLDERLLLKERNIKFRSCKRTTRTSRNPLLHVNNIFNIKYYTMCYWNFLEFQHGKMVNPSITEFSLFLLKSFLCVLVCMHYRKALNIINIYKIINSNPQHTYFCWGTPTPFLIDQVFKTVPVLFTLGKVQVGEAI